MMKLTYSLLLPPQIRATRVLSMHRGISSVLPFFLLLEVFSFLLRFHSTTALKIEPPLPSIITVLQPVAFTWIREPGDPEHFGFQKLPTGRPPSEVFTVFREDKKRGEFMITFSVTTPNALAAIDLDSNNQVTFFTGDNLVILPATQTANSPASPSTQSTSSSPAITNSSSVFGTTAQPTVTSDPIVPATTSQRNGEIVTSSPPAPTAAEFPHKSENSTPIIVGSTVGGVLLLLVIILVLRYRPPNSCVGSVLASPKCHHRHRQSFGITPRPIPAPHVPPSSSRPPDDYAEPGRSGDLEVMERAFQGLRNQVSIMAQRMAQLESELVEQGPPDYTSNPSHPLETR
ncbi:hypothetical protein PQX77_002270 [Marasmius sp. AFHP31]|nr:hypothetical protein PQX77_002270 [Marasmius sp. AFHP31]